MVRVRKTKRFERESGSTMVTALWVMVILSVIGAVTAVTSTNEQRSVGNIHRGNLGLYAAEGGLMRTEHDLDGKWYTELTGMSGQVVTNRASLNWDQWASWSNLSDSSGTYRAYVNPNESLAVIEVLPEGVQLSRGRTSQSPYDESWGATRILLRSVGRGKASYNSVRVHLDALALSLKKLP
ncbi:MAG: pilus assembly PilX N-terminal domain-containing protein [Deltaproteobacteria bacterium]|nr:pilus assembly PilX N-terminal domain-containing protein [Deltaproteobacteria bacterium]